ncbi:hypothetical protein MUK42_09150 [Musa troglodytarum]|uniref:Uncharacterized protein n=1 Tax=Musa troglodytarum TaxID=320322 RepID=A0A9E7JYH5_9LILI|nr:hypothetical protein MUK42_09150 [Musa troglodytarum]
MSRGGPWRYSRAEIYRATARRASYAGGDSTKRDAYRILSCHRKLVICIIVYLDDLKCKRIGFGSKSAVLLLSVRPPNATTK